MSEPLSREKEIERLTAETSARGFVEYPKMLHKTDGGHVIVTSKREEESALSEGDVHPTPADALAEKHKRDAAEAKRRAEKIGAEAKSSGKEPKN
jgi:hypothetical protein